MGESDVKLVAMAAAMLAYYAFGHRNGQMGTDLGRDLLHGGLGMAIGLIAIHALT